MGSISGIGRAAALSVVLVFLGAEAQACTVPPSEAFAPAEALVVWSPRIALAIVEQARLTQRGVEFAFKTVEVLKGSAPNGFVLDFERSNNRPGAAPDKDFNGHRDLRWGISGETRADVMPSCQISADFKIGRKYLIFIDQPYHVLGFEQIITDDDRWLAEVRRLVRDGN